MMSILERHNGGGDYCTPIAKKTRSCINGGIAALKRASSFGFGDSPFLVPPSPMMKMLGCGTGVTVYRYKRKSSIGGVGSPWAIKKAKCGRTRTSVITRLKTEGEILRQLNHPNVVKFKKLTMTDKGEVCLSMEAFGKGLDDIINDRQMDERLFSSRQIMAVTWNIAHALHYLHNTVKLLHGDIKAGNILVKGDFLEIKLCDFGVSLFLKDDLSGPKNPSDTYVGSEPWLSKEILNGQLITDKADIFSYGLVIWEMLALDVPHVGLMSSGDETLDGTFSELNTSTSSIPDAYFDALGTRPPLPDYGYPEEYQSVIDIFLCCTTEDYLLRPSAQTIVNSLGDLAGERKRKESELLSSCEDGEVVSLSEPDNKRRRTDSGSAFVDQKEDDPTISSALTNDDDKENDERENRGCRN